MPQCGKGSPADGSPQRVIGVDGCSAGWFFIALEPSVGDVWRIGGWGIVCHFSCLVGGASRPAWIFVDLPIGLPDQVKEGRQCDKCARKVLGVRRNSVFPAPARYLLKASDFPEAKSLSDGAKDKAPSIQAFSILPKIREVDCLLRRDPKLKKIVREVHPEVCFWAFNGRRR